jgi:hypothetical protein
VWRWRRAETNASFLGPTNLPSHCRLVAWEVIVRWGSKDSPAVPLASFGSPAALCLTEVQLLHFFSECIRLITSLW